MTKKSVFQVSLIGFLLSIIINPYIVGFCSNSDKYCVFGSLAHSVGKPMFIIFLPLFLFSIVTYKMSDKIFQSWLKFTYIWIPLTIVLTLLAPEYGGNLLPIEKDSVSFAMSTLFLLISLILVIYKHLSSKR